MEPLGLGLDGAIVLKSLQTAAASQRFPNKISSGMLQTILHCFTLNCTTSTKRKMKGEMSPTYPILLSIRKREPRGKEDKAWEENGDELEVFCLSR